MKALLSLIVFSSLLSPAQELIDSRDGRAYSTVQIGSLLWMTENLKFNTENSFCLTSESSDDCREVFYDYQEASSVCPEGWRLPTVQDWDSALRKVHPPEKLDQIQYKKQFRVDLLDTKVWDLAWLNLQPAGRVEGGEWEYGPYLDLWTTDFQQDDPTYHMHFMGYIFSGHAHKRNIIDKAKKVRMFPVRCVCACVD